VAVAALVHLLLAVLTVQQILGLVAAAVLEVLEAMVVLVL
jgi:hypothetical protein